MEGTKGRRTRARGVGAAIVLLLVPATMVALGSGGARASTPDGVVVAGTNDGKLYTSTNNGVTWTGPNTPFIGTTNGLAKGYDHFVVGYGSTGAKCGKVARSADGVSWTLHDLATAMCFKDIDYRDGRFIATGVYTSGTGFIATSSDGLTWTERSSFASTTGFSLAYGGGVWVAGTGSTSAYRSVDDGLTWSPVSLGCTCNQVFYAGDRFFISGASNTLRTSIDGSTWTFLAGQPNQIFVDGLRTSGGLYVFATATAGVMTSPDLVTFTQRTAASINGPSIGLAADSTLVFGGYGGVYTSTDGITWTNRVSVLPSELNRVAAGVAAPPPTTTTSTTTTTTTVPPTTTTTSTTSTTVPGDAADGPCRWEWGGLQEPDPQPCPGDAQSMSLTSATRDEGRPVGSADLLALGLVVLTGSAVLRAAGRRT